jgi:ketosteroid isomerase-like protein
MSQRSVEIVREHFAATNEGDFQRAMAHYAEDVELVVHEGLEAGTFAGREEAGRWFGEWFRSFQRGYRFELEAITDLGNAVFVVATHGGRGKASGAEVWGSAAYIYRLRNERITCVDMYSDTAKARQDAGLSE